jgi:hypothetical protein
MQPHTEHSHTSPVLHLGSHTLGSLLRSRKAVGVSKKAGLLFAWMILGVLLVGCLPSNAPPPGDPYAEPDTTSQTFGEGWTPEANSVHLNPRITCSADPTPANVANAVRGVNIVNSNVVLINPQVEGCSVGILVRAGGFKLLADKSKVGYASAASPALQSNYRGIVFDRGSFGYEVKGLNEGELFMRNNYIPINLQAGYDCLIADTDIDHPTPLDWDSTGRLSGSRRAKVGIKARAGYDLLPLDDRSLHDCVIRSNDVSGFEEEGISLDANGGGRDEVTLVQGSSSLSAVDAAKHTVTLAQLSGGSGRTYRMRRECGSPLTRVGRLGAT